MEAFQNEFADLLETGTVRIWGDEIVLVLEDNSVIGIGVTSEPETAAEFLRGELCGSS